MSPDKVLGNGNYFVIIASRSHPVLLIYSARCKLTCRSAVEINIGNEIFTVTG